MEGDLSWEELNPIPNNKFKYLSRIMWDRFGWGFAFVDCNDIQNSNSTRLLPFS